MCDVWCNSLLHTDTKVPLQDSGCWWRCSIVRVRERRGLVKDRITWEHKTNSFINEEADVVDDNLTTKGM